MTGQSSLFDLLRPLTHPALLTAGEPDTDVDDSELDPSYEDDDCFDACDCRRCALDRAVTVPTGHYL